MKDVISSLKVVFARPFYTVFAFLVILVLGITNIFLPHKVMIVYIFRTDRYDWSTRLKFLGMFLLDFGIDNTTVSKILIAVIIVLAGVSTAMLVYYIKRHLHLEIASGASFVGIILSLIGVGCATCGSVAIISIFGLSTTAVFISFLPLQGLEFGLLALILLIWSIYSVSKKVQKPLVCEIPQRKQGDN